jgi:hypothetical protein
MATGFAERARRVLAEGSNELRKNEKDEITPPVAGSDGSNEGRSIERNEITPSVRDGTPGLPRWTANRQTWRCPCGAENVAAAAWCLFCGGPRPPAADDGAAPGPSGDWTGGEVDDEPW